MIIDVPNEAANSCDSSNEDGFSHVDCKPETPSPVPGSIEICTSQRRLYECTNCTKKFTTFQGLRVHRRSHAEKHGYECMICNRRFNTWQRFRGHRRTHTNGLGLECSHCSKRFNSELGLKIHYAKYHTERKTFECDVCKESFRSEQKLKFHSRYHTDVQQHVCLVCKESFSTRLALRLHNRTHSETPVRTSYTSQEPIECIYCKKGFPNLKAIAGHHRYCTSRSFTEISVPSSSQPNTSPLDASHECSICKKRFIELRSLSFHIRTHKFLTERCDECFRSFRSVKHLNYHRKRMHSENNQRGTMIIENGLVRYECKLCRKVFTNEKALVCHSDNIHRQQEKTDAVTTGNEEMSVKCTICNTILKNEQGLRSHKGKMHKQNGQQSDVRTASENSLHREPGNAGVGDQTNTTSTEKEHMTYECKICSMVFRNARALRIHSGKDHRLENDTALSFGNSFLTPQESTDTNDQIDNQHVRYECTICNVVVNTARGLACHRSRVHKQQNDTFEESFISEPENTAVNNQIESANTKNYRMTYECTPCNMTFRNVRALRSHSSRMHRDLWRDMGSASEDIVLTEAENANTNDEMEIAAADNEDVKYECTPCNRIFKNIKGLRSHNTTIHKLRHDMGSASEDTDLIELGNTNTNNQLDIATPDNEQVRSECIPCNRIFRNERALRTHTIRMHKKKNLWHDMRFTYENNFRTDPGSTENATIDNGQVGFECTPCNRIFESIKGLRCHNSTIHKDLQHDMESASADAILTDPRNTDTNNQMEIATPDNERSECTPCNRIFRNERALRTHTIRMHKKNLWHDMGLTYENNFRIDPGNTENAITDNGQLGFECTPCNRIFESIKGLRCHNTTVHKNLQHDMGSASEDAILTEPGNTNTNNRMEIATPDNEQVRSECTPCNRIFESLKGLRYHNTTVHKNLQHDMGSASEDAILTEPGNTNTNNQMEIATPHNKQVRSKCTSCNRIFRNERALRTHTIKMHKKKNLWRDMELTYEDNFRTDPGNTENATINNEQMGLECTLCNRIFQNMKGLRCHITTIHKDLQHDMESASEDAIPTEPANTNTNNQMEIATPDNERSECTPCNRIFKNERALRAHNSSVHKQKNFWHFMTYEDPGNTENAAIDNEQVGYECTICNLVVKSARGLASHKTRIHKQKNLQNDMVSEVEDGFVTEPENTGKNNETGSITTDNDQMIYECTPCNMTFRNVRGLRSHSSRMHRDLWHDMGSASDNEDVLTEPGNTNINDQMGIAATDNEQERRLECTTCNLVFDNARGLACHNGKIHKQKNLHSGEDFVTEPDTCSNKEIKGVATDNEGVRRYECTLCNIAFKNVRGLRSHSSKIHKHLWHGKGSASEDTGPGNATNDQMETATTVKRRRRRFVCAICKLFFKNKRDLARHSARFHKQKKSQNDKMSVIEDNFLAKRINADENDQTDSTTTENEEMRYMCHQCGMIFKNKRELRSHSLRVHNQADSLSISSDVSDSELKFEFWKYKSRSHIPNSTDKDNTIIHDLSGSSDGSDSSLRFEYWNYKDRNQLHNSTDKDNITYNKSNNESNVDVTENGDANKEYDCPDCDRTFDGEMGLLVHRAKLHKTPNPVKYDSRGKAVLNHQCSVCDKSFRTSIGCTMHTSRVHRSSFSGETLDGCETSSELAHYECLVCNETFDHLKGFRIHCTKQQHMVGGNIDQHPDENTTKCYECTSCGKRYFSLKNYNRHISRTHDVRSAAALSTETIPETSQAVASSSSPSLKEMFSCVLCDKSYRNKNDLKVHFSSVHSECNSEVQEQIIADALQNLELTSTVKCCNKLFTSDKGLKIHQKRLHRDGDFSPKMPDASVEEDNICLVCDKVFMNKRRLAIHEAKYHSATESPEKTSSTEDTDAVNSAEERETLSYECSLCKMSFTSNKSLNLHHRKTHNNGVETATSNENAPSTEEKRFECSFCKSVFYNEMGLKIHCSRNHKFELRMALFNNMDAPAENDVENSSPTACSICNEELYTEEELTLHYNKTHTEVFCSREKFPPAYTYSRQKDYDCRDCEETFSSEDAFRAHENDHQSDEGSTECNLCHIDFITSSSLQLHNQQAHTSAPD
ncbi:uncharacterized protein [Periplaneta americana]